MIQLTHAALAQLMHTVTRAWARDDHTGQALISALGQRPAQQGAWADDALAQWLYAHWYQATPDAPTPADWRPSLAPLLQAALLSTARWPRGWAALQALPGGRWLAGQGPHTRVLAPGEWANVSRPGVPPAAGDELAVPDRLGWLDDATGFWAARSTRAEPTGPLCRVYASADWPQLPRLLRALLPLLDAWGQPWSLKCPGQAPACHRVDTLVLYLARSQRDSLLHSLAAHGPALQAGLRPLHPPLACPLATGLAWADSPDNGLSFGQARCLTLAGGLRQSWPQPLSAPPATAQALPTLLGSMRAAGIHPAAPWLEPAACMANATTPNTALTA